MALTAKKKAFADAVIAGKTNKDAAIAAGYSEKTASAAGSRLVKDKDIAAYIASHKNGKKKTTKKPQESEQAPPPDDAEKKGYTEFDLDKILHYADPKAFLLAVMNDQDTDRKLRVDAAKGLLPFMHVRLGEGGKKDAAAEAAKKAGNKFAPTSPPKLVVNNRK